MQNQITTIGDGKEFIQSERLAVLRAVMQPERPPTTSHLYRFYSTWEMIEALRGHGWLPVKAQEQRVVSKYEGRLCYQKHMIRFRNQDYQMDLKEVGDIAPEFILTNAHDGSSKWDGMFGFIRFACLNGLIVSEGEFGHIKIKHIGHEAAEVIEASYQILKEVPRLTEKVKTYRQIVLPKKEQEIFAEAALILKYNDKGKLPMVRKEDRFDIGERGFSIPQLLRPFRLQDDSPTLWNTFNTIQEKIVKGSKFERTIHRTPDGRRIEKRKVPAITGINETLRVNRGLWHLMEEMSKQKQ